MGIDPCRVGFHHLSFDILAASFDLRDGTVVFVAIDGREMDLAIPQYLFQGRSCFVAIGLVFLRRIDAGHAFLAFVYHGGSGAA